MVRSVMASVGSEIPGCAAISRCRVSVYTSVSYGGKRLFHHPSSFWQGVSLIVDVYCLKCTEERPIPSKGVAIVLSEDDKLVKEVLDLKSPFSPENGY
ncbi:hypothetical protein TNIN_434651 [Trichonephila inaurata madagascariensis]|uniref:Uncharacterized protein n=1 Tax=Trichonephila inaurata madagascariensis TaxID=2747483 RepID=A0A8X6WVS5_9ARAC|nr:hypothetical protein TNIN_434651 [Trichonephila inaurata madagascariensis]